MTMTPSSPVSTVFPPQAKVPEVDHRLKELRGFIILNRRDDNHVETDECMLFLDRIHFLRIRKKNQ